MKATFDAYACDVHLFTGLNSLYCKRVRECADVYVCALYVQFASVFVCACVCLHAFVLTRAVIMYLSTRICMHRHAL